MKAFLLSAAAFAGLAFATAAASAPAELFGRWRNPADSVHMDIRPCGASACGSVVWASPQAQADARRGSGRELVGLQLFRDFAPAKRGWRGKVFVPDLNRTLAGTARLLDPSHLEARGCLLGNVLCRTQVWSRVVEGGSALGKAPLAGAASSP
jgi:uncharacterized protein (DUF2147 family)